MSVVFALCAIGAMHVEAASLSDSAANASGDSPVFVNDSEPGSLTVVKTAADGDDADFKFKVVVTTPDDDGITGSWIYKALTGKVLSGTATVADVVPGEAMSVTIGDDGTLSSAGELTYEWHKIDADGNDDIVGTSSTYTMSASDEGSSFYCILKDADGAYAGWVKSSEGECKKNTKVKYAVQLLGIKQDTTTRNGTTYVAGLSFGNATGANFVSQSWGSAESGATTSKHTQTGKTTSAGNAYRCIHGDDWETIVYWASEDPEVYTDCVSSGCTKTVELSMNSTFAGTNSAYYTDAQVTGDGFGQLLKAVYGNNYAYCRWNGTSYSASYGTAGGWAASWIRRSLNGSENCTDAALNTSLSQPGTALTESEALISCFPSALQENIVAKDVKTVAGTASSSGTKVTTHDKLWLLSTTEIGYHSYGEGVKYQKFNSINRYPCYSDYSASGDKYNSWWTRSVYGSPGAWNVYGNNSNVNSNSGAYGTNCLAPGFCLGEIETKAFAVYSADDNSLNFYRETENDIPSAGDTYNGLTVTNVYMDLNASNIEEKDIVKDRTKPQLNAPSLSWSDYASEVKSVSVVDEGICPEFCSGWFYSMSNLTYCDISKLDVSNVRSMRYMFGGCSSLTSLTLPKNFDTSNVMNMEYMFGGCSSLEALTLPDSFDTSSVTTMYGMFYKCSSLIALTIPESFDTGNVTNMDYMFNRCSNLASLNLPDSFDTSSITNMSYMFYSCSSLSLNCSSWDVSKATSYTAFNYNASNVIAPTWVN